MDKNFFYSAEFPVPLYFEPTPWQNTLPSGDLNFQSDQSPDCFLTPQEPFSNFNSALSSMVSSPGASNSAISADGLAIQELIGKLRTIDNSCGEAANMNAGSSVYSTPLNSPPKLQLPVMNQLVNIRNGSHAMNPNLPALSAADPGFAERAAKFSCFGSRSFNGRSNQFGIELPYRSTPSLTRVLSSPSLKVAGSSVAANKSLTEMRSTDTKMEESSVSEQDLNPRKRKTPSLKGKPKETIARLSANACKGAEQNGEGNTKRSKSSENGGIKVENDSSGSDGGKDANQKAETEAPKDYIHVRARRGQATDSHSLAERVRREKISERMKLLQDLVPGCNKVTGKAVMLDEIISYVQQLQQQVEFLSMKLASVNPTLEGLFTKDALSSSPHPAAYHHLDNSAAALFGQGNHYLLSNSQVVEEEGANNNNNNNVDDQFGQGHLLPKLPSFSEDDLHSLVMMGFGQKTNNRTSTSEMKLELL